MSKPTSLMGLIARHWKMIFSNDNLTEIGVAGNPYFSMTDEVYCANMASFIINRHPNMPVTEGALAIFIGTYTDANYESMMAGRLSCNHFAFAILEEFPYITDDYIVLAGTIEDWREKVKTGDIDSE